METIKWTCLKNNPDLLSEIKVIQGRLLEVVENNTGRHLADSAVLLGFISKDLKELSEKAFSLHNTQKF